MTREMIGPVAAVVIGFVLATGSYGVASIQNFSEGEQAVLDAFRALSGKPVFKEIWRDITALGSGIVLFTASAAIAACFFLTGRAREAQVFVSFSLAVCLMNLLLKGLIARLRPPDEIAAVVTLTSSFPSGHAFQTLAILGIAAILTPATAVMRGLLLALAAIVALATGTSRLVLGVHWPTDIIAGWGLALVILGAFALACRKFACATTRRG